MSSQPKPQVTQRPKEQGLPYCSDPNCKSCNELREIHELIESERVPEPNAKP